MYNRKIKLAFVDDSLFQQMLINRLVGKITVFDLLFVCKNGLELLHKLACSPVLPEICIIDLHMPYMDGNEVAKEIAERFPSIRLFGYTASQDLNEINSFRRSGVVKVFAKSNPIAMLNDISFYA